MMDKAEGITVTLLLLLLIIMGGFPEVLASSHGESTSTMRGIKLLWVSRTIGGVRAVLITRNGEIAIAGGKGFLVGLDADTGRKIWSIERPYQVDSMAMAEDGSLVIVGLEQARLWAIKGDGSIFWRLPTEGPVLALDLTPEGDRAVFGTFFGTLYFANPINQKVETIYRREGAAVIRVALSDDGLIATIGYSDDLLEGFRWSLPEPIWRIRAIGHLKVLAYSPMGDKVFLGSSAGILYALDPLNGKILWSFKANDSISCIAFLDDGSLMAVGSHDGYVYLIDANDGSKLWTYKIDGAVKSIAYIKNGSILCLGGTDRRFRALNMSTGELLGSIKAGYWVTSISSSENGIIAFGAGKAIYAVKIAIEDEDGDEYASHRKEGKPLQESLLYGVLIGAPILGVALYLVKKHRRRRRESPT